MLEKTKLLIGAYYLKNPIFAQIDEIFEYIDENGNLIKENLDAIQIEFLEKQIKIMKDMYLSLCKENGHLTEMEHNDFYNIFNKMIKYFYEEFNLQNCETPYIQIVKQFPHPFEKANFKAMNFNEHQAKTYNCQKGIYLLEKYTAHGISEIMLAHELMHYVIGELTPKNEQTSTAPFFEEAIVDIFGLYFLFKYNFISTTCIRNWLSFGRGNCEENYIGSLYFKEAKQMLWILKTSGMDELKKLANEGQGALSKLDMQKYIDKKINLHEADEKISEFISYYDYVFTNFNLNIKEYYVFSNLLNIEDGKKIDKLELPDFTNEELQEIIKRLVKKGLMYIYGDKVYNPNKAIPSTIKITLF